MVKRPLAVGRLTGIQTGNASIINETLIYTITFIKTLSKCTTLSLKRGNTISMCFYPLLFKNV